MLKVSIRHIFFLAPARRRSDSVSRGEEPNGAWTAEMHNRLYPANFNRGLADFLTAVIQPKDFIEFGGGTGELARHVARECRVTHSYMLEPDIPLTPDEGIELEALNIDITKHVAPRVLNRTFDLVLSIEVAEHVDRRHHERLFDFLAARSKRWVVFSGARPGQGGHGHVAERPEAEWRDEFTSRGFSFDARLTALARSMSDRKNINHRRNIQVFLAPPDAAELDSVEQAAAVHLDHLLAIVRRTGDFLDGNLFFVNLAEAIEGRPAHALRWKRENLVSVARRANRALEVGLNAGHAALLMLLANSELHVTAVDRLDHRYTRACFDYLAAAFPGRIDLIAGDSLEVLPRLPRDAFDLVHLDGGKEVTIARDLAATRQLVKRDHVLVIDDTQNAALNAVVDAAESQGSLDFSPFAEANARSRRSRWRHRLGRFTTPDDLKDASDPEAASCSRLRDIHAVISHRSLSEKNSAGDALPGIVHGQAVASAIRAIETTGLDGAFVDVGAAGGDFSTLAAVLASRFLPRDFYLFDDFDAAGIESGAVRDRMRSAGVPAENLLIVEGPADLTVPLFAPERVAMLRVNMALQAQAKAALETTYERILPGGWLFLEHYGAGAACRRAVDDFLAGRGVDFHAGLGDEPCLVLRK